jgi:hypothetical protein
MAPRKHGNPIFWTKEECLRSLYAWVRAHGHVPSENTDWRNAGPNHPSGTTCRRHFGSWSRFIRVAGLDPQTAGMKPYWTKDLVADWLLDHLMAAGRWPTVPELRRTAAFARPSYCTITRLFGSYTKAKRYAGWSGRCEQCNKPLGQKARGSQRFCTRLCRDHYTLSSARRLAAVEPSLTKSAPAMRRDFAAPVTERDDELTLTQTAA